MTWARTSVMPVVSNTSPLSNLAILGRLDLLREQLGTVNIPPGVRTELSRHPQPPARELLDRAIQDGWLCVVPLVNPVPADLAAGLHTGEAEAIALALETKATLVLLDETAARLKAHRLGVAHTGVLLWLLKVNEERDLASRKLLAPALLTVCFDSTSEPTSY